MSAALAPVNDVRDLVADADRDERTLVGVLLLQPELIRQLDVSVDDVVNIKPRIALSAMFKMDDEGRPVDVTGVDDEMHAAGCHDSSMWLADASKHAGRAAWSLTAAQSLIERIRLLRAHLDQEKELGDIVVSIQRGGDLGDAAARLLALRDRGAARACVTSLALPALNEFLGDDEPDDDDAEDWLIRDIVPRGEAWLFAGPWKVGKTWAVLALAVALALGVDFVGFKNELGRPARVLVVALEDGKRRLRKRLWQLCRGFGVTPNDERLRDNLRVVRERMRLPGAADARKALAAAMSTWGTEVMIVDSLSRVMDGDQNNVRDASAFTAAWLELGERTGAAVGFVHHMNKLGPTKPGEKRDPFDSVRGSGDLLAAPRHLVVVQRLDVEGAKLSAVSMRGNLDLRRETFALGFTQEDVNGRRVVRLEERGDPDAIRTETADAVKAARRGAKDAALDQRRERALVLARDRGHAVASAHAVIAGVSNATAARDLAELQELGLLGPQAGNSGRPITAAGLDWLAGKGVS